MKNKCEGNENKIILGEFNNTIDAMDRNGANKTQRLYKYCSSYTLSKLIVDNGLEDLSRRKTQIPQSPPITIDAQAQDPG